MQKRKNTIEFLKNFAKARGKSKPDCELHIVTFYAIIRYMG